MVNELLVNLVNSVLGTGKRTARGNQSYHCTSGVVTSLKFNDGGGSGTNIPTNIQAGMIFTIEPMINEGSFETKTLSDGWTAVTRDKKLSAQFEHTLWH